MKREPVVKRAVVVAFAAAFAQMVAVFLPMTADQKTAVGSFIAAAAVLLLAVWSRRVVTPVRDPRDDAGNVLVPQGGPDVPGE